MTRLRVATASAALLLGLVGLLGWTIGSVPLERIVSSSPPVRFNSAVLMTLLGAAWLTPRRIRAVLAAFALVVAVVTLAEYVLQRNLGLDQLVVSPHGGAHPGRMSVLTAGGFAVLAIGQLLISRRARRAAQVCGLLVLMLSAVVLLGYAYDVSTLYAANNAVRVSVPTAAALFLLSFAQLSAVPDGALSWVIDAPDAGAQMARRLLPLALVGLPVLGLVVVLLRRAGLFSDETTAAVIVIVCATAVGAFTWFVSRRLERVDRRRAAAIADLTALRIDLERQVSERASQLQSRRDEIAVLQDRQRIAADLHDIVIQRLFAAGMYLQSGADGMDDATQRRLDNAVEAMDTAIKDLRASIFELSARDHGRADMTSLVSELCTESARVLGFEPDVLIDDPDDDSVELREDILAVLREALANVARHAEATAVDVVLRAGDGQLWLSVTDNGKGISEGGHRSGTRNMAQRARGLGGDCTWTRVQPSGTRVLWRVPLDEKAPMVG